MRLAGKRVTVRTLSGSKTAHGGKLLMCSDNDNWYVHDPPRLRSV